jgi:hypothetical protein
MFNYIKTELSAKQREIQSIFIEIEELSNKQNELLIQQKFFAKEPLLNSLKGLIFVSLYGSIEYTVSEAVKTSEQFISLQRLHYNDVIPSLLTRFLYQHFDTLNNVGRKQKWQRRIAFMQKLTSNEQITENICCDLELPTDGQNIRKSQLEDIFKTFNIRTDLLNAQWGGRLKDIVDNRNAIAHGNKTAIDVGKTIFLADLKTRIDEVNAFCTEFISLFEEYIEKEEYKLP